MLEALQQQNFNIESIQQLQQLRAIVGTQPAIASESTGISSMLAFRIWTIGLPATIIAFLVATPFVKGIVGVAKSNYQKKFGKPQVPERPLNLHNNALKEVKKLGKSAERINDDKFTSEKFKLLIKIKVNVSKGIEGYPELNYKVELLRAAILAQKSFLKLEATEIRYRSRKQQEFYQYVTEHLEDEIDKVAFAEKIKQKREEILPLINSAQGKEAIESYAKEIDALSKHELGLKLLALFKKFELKDFSIIKDVSDVVEGLRGCDLTTPKNLIATVKEYYDLFQKIAPILGISQEEQSAGTYARILQVVALIHRHGKAYLQFKELITVLRKWEHSHETVTTIREQFSPQEYSLPSEFKEDIPGKSTYQKYAEYLADL